MVISCCHCAKINTAPEAPAEQSTKVRNWVIKSLLGVASKITAVEYFQLSISKKKKILSLTLWDKNGVGVIGQALIVYMFIFWI